VGFLRNPNTMSTPLTMSENPLPSSKPSTLKSRDEGSERPLAGQNHIASNEEKQARSGNEDEEHEPERQYVTGIARWLILGPVTLTYFTFFLDLAVLSTATPAITSDFNSLTDIGWYVIVVPSQLTFLTASYSTRC
jgi:hypothetical protein